MPSRQVTTLSGPQPGAPFNGRMSTHPEIPDHASFSLAADDIVPGHLAARRVQRQSMAVAACFAASVLAATIVYGYQTLRPLPDLVTFAFRV